MPETGHNTSSGLPPQPPSGTVSTAIIRLLVAAARDAGLTGNGRAIVPGASAEALRDDRNRVATASATLLWEYLVQTSRRGTVGVELARRAVPGELGVWDHLLTTGLTVFDGLRDGATYLAVLADADRESLEVRVDGDLVVVRHRSRDLEPELTGAVGEFAAGVVTRRVVEAAGRTVVPVRVGFVHRAPRGAGYREVADLLGTTRVDYEQPDNAITFLAADALAPVAHPRPGLPQILRSHADLLLGGAQVVGDWRALLRATLAASLPAGPPRLTEVAARLHISPRTLQRRLDEAGTSWRAEVDLVRAEQAQLMERALPQRAVAARLGYRDERSLRRAQLRWASSFAGPAASCRF
ncbi:AraC family transcriptional regulator ligand-binding domain-containing protein [Nocardia cyriacigeorgica]|uniref:AraC family transcriptional regulator ligand-binding domain-containing protein n=1 Tax=Nocardia cyriacigeorgica TaxID=135487 RepID=UPI0034DCCD3F